MLSLSKSIFQGIQIFDLSIEVIWNPPVRRLRKAFVEENLWEGGVLKGCAQNRK